MAEVMEIYYILFKPCTQQIQSVPLNFKERGLRAIKHVIMVAEDPGEPNSRLMKIIAFFFFTLRWLNSSFKRKLLIRAASCSNSYSHSASMVVYSIVLRYTCNCNRTQPSQHACMQQAETVYHS